MTLTIIGPVRTRTSRVLWCLEELGLAYDHVEHRPHSPEVTALNPLKQVPILLDGDAVITDSTAMLHYLADRAGRLTFAPGTPSRALLDARINFALTELDAPLWLKSRHAYVLPEELRNPAAGAVAQSDFALNIAKFDALLGDAEYFAGPDFTIADIVATHCLTWATGVGWDLPDRTAAYRDRMIARPAWARSRKGQ